jgi:hypothetical protein
VGVGVGAAVSTGAGETVAGGAVDGVVTAGAVTGGIGLVTTKRANKSCGAPFTVKIARSV